jgi:hypothetical protein
MKNKYTPKEYAHALAIDALIHALQNKFGELDDLTPADRVNLKVEMRRLVERLADEAKLDYVIPQHD